MKKIVLLLVLISSNTLAQIAIIKDKDGYTNVRSEPHVDSKVIHRILENDLFYYDVDADPKVSEWIKVYVPKNKYSVNGKVSSDIVGYIHSSRLLPIEQLEKYTGNDMVFTYQLEAFSPDNKIIDYQDRWITAVNGRPYYGTDGAMPTTEVKSIEITVKGKKLTVPKVLYEDLFECNSKFNIYQHKDIYFIAHWNSDGAGGYLLAWAIDSDGVRQRLILVP